MTQHCPEWRKPARRSVTKRYHGLHIKWDENTERPGAKLLASKK
jgi:hypothetical protein